MMNGIIRKTAFILPVMVLAALLLAPGCGEKEDGGMVAGPAINFITDYGTAMATAKEKGQPVIVDFYTDWCKWCKRLDSVTFQDSGVVALSQEIVFAKINAEADTVARESNSVRGYPSVLLFNSEGKEIDRIVGYLPPEEFIETIRNYLAGIGTLDYYLAVADTGTTPEIDFTIASKYGDRNMYDKAESYYQKVIKTNPGNEGDYTSHAMMSLADISLRQDNYDIAIKRYKDVKKRFPDSITVNDADIMMAICLREKGDTAAAIAAFEDFVKAHPGSPDTSYAMGQIEKLKNPPSPEE